MDEIIEIRDLKKSFGKLEVLKGIDCKFRRGEVVSVLGPNASGKTTLIKSILGMVLPDAGELLFNGQPVTNTFEYKRHIGYMPQIGRYPENMKMGQIFDMMRDLRQEHAQDEDLLKTFKLESMFHKPMHTLSGGTRQKVSAALAFMFNPEVLILDEPSAGLDPLASEHLKEKIKEQSAKGKLVLFTSHIMSEVDEIAGSILYLFEGKVRFFKELDAIKSEAGEVRLGKALIKTLI
ncbi:Cu-processing system ATP-binding protein [Arcticibacter pallidicorallinus]|uniref:Cu-processing system ATP-binding protein n=1 Tax=Arcticibacter pallidicorallinus TaxID=1259464 RepID=A0A2T0UBB4_9SPHI|nr:ABC transporter ATP-binding protein [Arcticibacter pallidicorallinus]PRY55203.1 Cu-processing system ATP-binding protein [Arcticibacter pallidicorallinus]